MSVVQHAGVDFIFMLTRHDRTVEDAVELVDAVCDLGVTHVGFKDIGVSEATMRELVAMIHRRGGTSYLEVVSTTPESVARSLATARALGVDCVLGGTDLEAARRALGDLRGYFPFPGQPVGHPTRLEGTPSLVAAHCARGARDGLRRRRPPRLPGHRSRSAGARARGSRSASGPPADRRRQRDVRHSRSRRWQRPASMHSRSARPSSKARSRPPRARCAPRSWTSLPPAIGRGKLAA